MLRIALKRLYSISDLRPSLSPSSVLQLFVDSASKVAGEKALWEFKEKEHVSSIVGLRLTSGLECMPTYLFFHSSISLFTSLAFLQNLSYLTRLGSRAMS